MDEGLVNSYFKNSILSNNDKGINFDWDNPDKYYTSGAGPTQYNYDHNFNIDGISLLKPKDTGGIMGGLSNWADKNKFGIGLIGGIADLGMGLAKYGLTKDYFKARIGDLNQDIAAKRQKIASRNGIQAAFSGVRV